MKVTRLIRISYGDYNLLTIPPGMAIEVPIKPLESQKLKGNLWTDRYSEKSLNKKKAIVAQKKKEVPEAIPIQWVRNI